jgi:hypothetical protein
MDAIPAALPFDAPRIVSAAVLARDAAACALDNDFRPLVSGELASAIPGGEFVV